MRKLIMTAIVAGTLAVGPTLTLAAVLYSNGPINGTINAWTINGVGTLIDTTVADSFDLTSAASVTEIDFGAWNESGDVITAVDWSITSTPGGGTTYGSGTGSVSSSFQFTNALGFDVYQDSFTLGPLSLAAGTYFLNLQHAVTSNGDIAFWDENDGPSIAWQSQLGFIAPVGSCLSHQNSPPYCSESFQVIGTSSAVPEPASMMLLGAGLAALALARRRHKSA